MKTKRLIIIRHAHRDTSKGREIDNGLSAKGKGQVKLLSKYLELRIGKPSAVFSSFSKRCVQTVRPYTSHYKIKLQIADELYEQLENESWKKFKNRIHDFTLSQMKHYKDTIVFCSHGDWIPSFFEVFMKTPLELKKGGVSILEWNGRKFSLVEHIQQFT